MEWKFGSFTRLHLLIIILFCFISASAIAQEKESCAEKLKIAQTLFENGQVDQVPLILKDCLKSGFIREEALTAYKLLIQSSLFEDELKEADSAMLSFLKKNPEYLISPTDHLSFVNLYNNFRVKPLVQVAFHIGTNMPFISVQKVKTTAGFPGKSSYDTKPFNLFASFEAKFELTGKIELNAEVGYSRISFSNVEEYLGFGEATYKEEQIRIEVPVSLTYNFFSFDRFKAYGRLGLGPAFILGANAQAGFDPTDVNNPFRRTGSDLDRIDSRIPVDLLTQIGAGLKYKIRNGFFFTEIRSNFGFRNQSVPGGASSEELRVKYLIKDDEFRSNALNFNLGYIHIFYRPSKKKV